MCKEEAEHYIGSKGIDNDTLVIAYDDFKGPNATGVYAFFKSFGHEKVKILNGGRAAMMAADPEQKIYDGIGTDRTGYFCCQYSYFHRIQTEKVLGRFLDGTGFYPRYYFHFIVRIYNARHGYLHRYSHRYRRCISFLSS
jgi:hypothetical protein